MARLAALRASDPRHGKSPRPGNRVISPDPTTATVRVQSTAPGHVTSTIPTPGESAPFVTPCIVAKDAHVFNLAKRTLTNLYNERPTWLDLAHKALDEAVFDAYGWDPSMSDEQILAALLELNLERSDSSGTANGLPENESDSGDGEENSE